MCVCHIVVRHQYIAVFLNSYYWLIIHTNIRNLEVKKRWFSIILEENVKENALKQPAAPPPCPAHVLPLACH